MRSRILTMPDWETRGISQMLSGRAAALSLDIDPDSLQGRDSLRSRPLRREVDPRRFVDEPARSEFEIETLPLDELSVEPLAGLPDLHRDPFDRMLICQALEHGLTLATVDPVVRAYPVPVW